MHALSAILELAGRSAGRSSARTASATGPCSSQPPTCNPGAALDSHGLLAQHEFDLHSPAPSAVAATAVAICDAPCCASTSLTGRRPAASTSSTAQPTAVTVSLPLQPVAVVSQEVAAQSCLLVAQARVLPVSAAHGYDYATPVAPPRITAPACEQTMFVGVGHVESARETGGALWSPRQH